MWVEMEVFTPTHIGNGSDLNPMEYWIDETLARIHPESLFRDPDFLPHQEKFIQGATHQRYLGQYLPPELLSRHVRYEVPISPGAREYLVKHQVVVKEYIKSAGRAFIPGSSIKGSLFSAMIYHVLRDLYQREDDRKNIDYLLRNQNQYSNLLDLAITALQGKKEPGEKDLRRFFNWLRVSDSDLALPEESLQVYYSQVVGSKSGGKLPILFEGLVPETTWCFSLLSTEKARFREEEILQVADRFYRLIWKKNGHGAEPPTDRYLLRLGQGSSAWATSLLLFAESAGIQGYSVHPPRTKKLVDGRIPMGWALLTSTENPVLRKILRKASSGHQKETRGSVSSEIRKTSFQPQHDSSKAGEASQKVVRPTTPPPTPDVPVLDRDRKAGGLLGQVAFLVPQDKLMLKRIVDGLDHLDDKEAAQVASALRDKLKTAGTWDKHPLRFEIECYIDE